MSQKILGLGVDLVRISRVRLALERRGPRFASRILAPEEQKKCNLNNADAAWIASRFAAKEACLKALGSGWSGGAAFHQVQVQGERSLTLTGAAGKRAAVLGVTGTRLSVAVQGDLVGALVLLTGSR